MKNEDWEKLGAETRGMLKASKDDICAICKMPRQDHQALKHHCPKGHWDFAETVFTEVEASPQGTRPERRKWTIRWRYRDFMSEHKPAVPTPAVETPQGERSQQSHQQNPFIEAVLGQGRAVAAVETRLTAEKFYTQLRKEWMAQDKTLDYTNWLQDEVMGLREDSEELCCIHQKIDAYFDKLVSIGWILEKFDELREENEQLKAWKESQIKVTPDWQKIGELLNIGWGQSVTENIIPALTELRAKLAEKSQEISHAHEASLIAEQLRAELTKLREAEREKNIETCFACGDLDHAGPCKPREYYQAKALSAAPERQ